MKKNKNIEPLFYAFLGISAAVIPFPENNLSSISLILLILGWILYWAFGDSKISFANKKWELLALAAPLILAILGLTYTDNLNYGLKKVTLLLPFIIYPLVIGSTKIDNRAFHFVFKCFVLGTFLAALMGIGRAAYFKLNSLGNYFYYEEFSKLIGKHTTYFSLFLVISSLYVIYELLQKRIKLIGATLLLLLFLITLYVTSARISLVALAFSSLVLIVFQLKSKWRWILAVCPLFFLSIFFLPNFQKRFDPNQTEVGTMSDFEFRKLHWKSVLETIQHQSLLVGKGTGSTRNFLYEKYQEYKLTSAYQEEYNAHNQYLEIVLDFGLLGFVLFLGSLIYIFSRLWKTQNSLGIAIFCCFLIYFLTESLLLRHDGVVMVSLFLTISLFKIKSK